MERGQTLKKMDHEIEDLVSIEEIADEIESAETYANCHVKDKMEIRRGDEQFARLSL